MLDWLDTATPKTPPDMAPPQIDHDSGPGVGTLFPPMAEDMAPPQIDHDSGAVRGDTIFTVSRFRDAPETQNREGSNPYGCEVFTVSRFSRFQNEGGPTKDGENGPQGDEKPQAIPEHLPELLDAVAAILTAGEQDHLRTMSGTDPDTVADACRLLLNTPPMPTPEDVAELDGLMVRLCGLVPWLAGFLPAMQAARLRMAPADVAGDLARFRRWVREAERRAAPAAGRGG